MICYMNGHVVLYPWEPIEITADDLETEIGMEKLRLAVRRARIAAGAAFVERMLFGRELEDDKE